YADLFGEATKTGNKVWLIKRVAWRLQAMAEGGLSERAQRRAAELANEADLRLSPPKPAPERTTTAVLPMNGNRLPPVGTMLTRLSCRASESHLTGLGPTDCRCASYLQA